MPFESVWGFDPDRAIHHEGLPESASDTDYSSQDQRAAHIPPDVDSQVYELRRIYRL